VYFQIVAVPSIAISLMTIFGSILRSAGDTRSPMKVGLWINLLHIVLAYLLIFGIGDWAGWGIAGAAWATTVSRLIGVLALYGYIKKSIVAFSLLTGWSGEFLLPLLEISGPAVIERLIMRLGQLLYAGLIVRLGTDVYSAFIFGGNISYFSFMPGYGLAVAATTLVGNHVGANRKSEAYEYGIVIMCLAAIFMGVIGAVYFSFAAMAGTWFTNDQHVIDMVATGLRIDAFAQPFIAISLVITGALQGAGDTKSPMYSTISGIWLIRVAGIYGLCFYFDLGIAGVWLVNLIDYMMRSVFLFYRFRKQMCCATS
jgi:putative MATE family efflux protein